MIQLCFVENQVLLGFVFSKAFPITML